MNVANRKLFANRDARQKLANMGGIMASSPELLGEAQKFAPGGQVNKQEYIINVPGFTQPGEYLRVSEETLMMLNNTIPDLMSQQNTLVEPADLVGGYVKARPGDAVVGTRLRRMSEESAPVSEAVTLEQGPTIRDVVREGLSSSYSIGPGEALSNYLQSDDVSQLREAASNRPGLQMPGLVTPDEQNPMVQLVESMVGSGEAPSPQPELTVQNRTVDTPAFQELQRQLAEQRTDVPGFNMPGESTTYEIDPTAALAAGESMSIGDQMLGLGFTGGDIDPSAVGPQLDPVAQAREDEINSLLSVFDDPNRTEAQVKAARQRLEQIGAKDRAIATATETLEGIGQAVTNRIASDAADIYGTLGTGANLLGSTDTATALFEAQKEAEAKVKPSETRARKESEEAAAATTEEVTTEEPATTEEPTTTDAPTTTPPPADASPLDTDKIVTTANDPDSSAADRNKKTSAQVLGGLGVPNADKMSIDERVSTYEKLFKEMLGEKDEKVASEMWHNMAMIGFSIAAGESPNALKNIASGLLEGTKMMREDRATRQAREDKIGMLALEAGMADKRAEEKYARDVAIAGMRASGTSPYEKMPTLQEAIDDAAKVEMSSAASLGKSMTYAEAIQKVTPAVTRLYTGQTVTAASDPDAENREAAANTLGL